MSKYKYFAYDPVDNSVGFFETKKEALEFVEGLLEFLREEAVSDGWVDEEVERIVVGVITHEAVKCNVEPTPEGSQFDEICDYEMQKIRYGVKIDVKEIVRQYLIENGYDGLFNFSMDCSCDLGDLMSCFLGKPSDCEPGYKVPCDAKECDGECYYHISPVMEATDED